MNFYFHFCHARACVPKIKSQRAGSQVFHDRRTHVNAPVSLLILVHLSERSAFELHQVLNSGEHGLITFEELI